MINDHAKNTCKIFNTSCRRVNPRIPTFEEIQIEERHFLTVYKTAACVYVTMRHPVTLLTSILVED